MEKTPGHHNEEATTPTRGATPRQQQPDGFHIASFLAECKALDRFS
jgi:hypothetical protein